MTIKTNKNMSHFTILKEDGWIKIADKDDVVNMQNQTDTTGLIQPVDANEAEPFEPELSVDWGFKLYPRVDKPYACTHNVYARATTATLQIVVQKD